MQSAVRARLEHPEGLVQTQSVVVALCAAQPQGIEIERDTTRTLCAMNPGSRSACPLSASPARALGTCHAMPPVLDGAWPEGTCARRGRRRRMNSSSSKEATTCQVTRELMGSHRCWCWLMDAQRKRDGWRTGTERPDQTMLLHSTCLAGPGGYRPTPTAYRCLV